MTYEETIRWIKEHHLPDEHRTTKTSHDVAMGMAIEALEKQSEIVHCKDCKHWVDGVAGCTECIKMCEYAHYMVGENGFCTYGEWSDEEL